MRNKGYLIICAVSVLLHMTSACGQQTIEGTWLGTLEFSGVKMRVVFNIARDSSGKLVSTLDSPDQGAKGIPVEQTTLENGRLRLNVSAIAGGYEGEVNSDYSEIVGTWSQKGASLPLTLMRTDKVEEIVRPQDPKPPYSYIQREVSYENRTAGVTFGGTLTLPIEEGPFPAVLLITGSGSQDRNETIFGHHPFWVIADYLTRRGLAVLRVDDRGIGKSTGSSSKATTEDFAGDVLAGVEYLKSLNEIDPEQIGLIGHSEGGVIAPMAAVRSPDVAFIVLMAGIGVTGKDLLRMQNELILRTSGASDSLIAKSGRINQALIEAAMENPDSAKAYPKIRRIFDDAMSGLSEEERQQLEMTPSSEDMLISQLLSPWMRYFVALDPRPILMKVRCPVLALNGRLDLQVPSKENLGRINEALKAGGNDDVTIKELPGLNHLFQHAETGSPAEYSSIEETISPDALKIMGDWIAAHTNGMK